MPPPPSVEHHFTFSPGQGLSAFVHAGHAGGDAGNDVAGDGLSASRQLLPRHVGPQDFRHITGLHIVHVGDVHHDLIHGHTTEHGAVRAVEVDTGPRIGEVVQIAVAEADADGRHLGGSRRNIGVVVGNTVVVRQCAQQGHAAVEREGGL